MAVTMTIVETDVGKLFNPGVFTGEARMRLNGANPYVVGGYTPTAALIQTALNTYLGYSAEKIDVESFESIRDDGPSLDGTYYASWDGTTVMHFLTTTGVEAGAIDLSAVTTDVYALVRFTFKY